MVPSICQARNLLSDVLKRSTLKDIAMNLDWQKDRNGYSSIYARQAEINRRGLKEIYVNLDKQEIERDSGE